MAKKNKATAKPNELRSRITRDLGVRRKGSEGAQDKWVMHCLNSKKGGFFVDCGAAHPIKISNTWMLETQLNWKGICIEPNKYFFEMLEDAREALCLNMAVSNETGELEFRQASFASSLLKNEDMFNAIATHELVTIQCDTLINILDKHNAPKIIDYLDLDIPGAELDVTSSFDFDKYKIKCLTVKRNPNNMKEVQEVLEKHGFVRKDDLYIDMAFLHEENLCLP